MIRYVAACDAVLVLPKKEPKKSFNVRLPASVHARLEEFCYVTGRSPQDALRPLIEALVSGDAQRFNDLLTETIARLRERPGDAHKPKTRSA